MLTIPPIVAELFKDRLRNWRGKHKQIVAAMQLGVPLATYRKWETGKRTPKKLTQLGIEQVMTPITPPS